MEEKELDNQQAIELKQKIKGLMAFRGFTLETLAEALNKEYPVKESKANLSNKLNRGSLRFIDVMRIANVLNYKIEFLDNKS